MNILIIKLILLLFIIQLLFSLSRYITTEDRLLNSIVVQNEIKTFIQYPNEIMWKRVDHIDEDNPFVFFHQRKAGGTSIRHGLMIDSKNKHLSNYIMCYSITICDDYHLPNDKKYAIYAGHFPWNSLIDLNRLHVNNVLNFSCTTNFREPISRIKSCLYYRFSKEISDFQNKLSKNKTSQCLQYFPIYELEKLLTKRDKYGNSCLDEPFRILSGFYDPDFTSYDGISFDLNDMIQAFRLTLHHITKCAPVVLELPHSYQLIAHRFPQFLYTFKESIHDNINSDFSHCRNVSYSIEQEKLFKKYSVLERLLYKTIDTKISTMMLKS